MNFFDREIDDVLSYLQTDSNGLSKEEVVKRLKLGGKNCLAEAKKDSKFKKFINEFRNLMIIILIFSAFVSFLFSFVNGESIIDSVIILCIVFLNAMLGFVQELKADKSIEALKKMQVTNIKVRRNGKVFSVHCEDIVRGDIIVLESGDAVPADARIFSSISLRVNESSLTGESQDVFKNSEVLSSNADLANRSNMLYSGTYVVYGKCEAVVCEIGNNTEIGKIAQSLNEKVVEETPLQKKINDISKFLSVVIAFIILVMFLVGIFIGMDLKEVIMLSVSLAVAAIPEGLPAVITITLSLGMGILAKKNAIVRKMASVETLGCTEIICSDKTGTITQNKMMIREVFYDNKVRNINNSIDFEHLLFQIMCLNNDAVKTENGYLGDSTEVAMLECLEHFLNILEIKKNSPRVDELLFDSERKMMSTIHKVNDDIYLYTKGSFDSIISRCNYVLENNKLMKLTKQKREFLKKIESEESEKAYRVLAYAYRKLDFNYECDFSLEYDLVFVGMTAMIDPPREDVEESILVCKEAHIRPIMITGDSLNTAVAIAKEVGIFEEGTRAVTGVEIDQMTEEELQEEVSNISVYARVSPTNKLAIVNAWKNKGKCVAMTGDGVNDAPALKASDIGVGMGITGTEVTKEAADIILADDSFSTIVTAVFEGRRIVENIRNVLVYLLTGNLAEVFVVFIGMLMGLEIFLPIQLLYINLITDSIPAIALAFEKSSVDIMTRDIRNSDQSLFTPFLIAKMTLSSILKTLIILIVYFLNYKVFGNEIAITMSFLTLILSEMVFAISCKDLKNNVIGKKLFQNKFMNYSMLFLGILQILVFVTPLKNLFGIVDLNGLQVLYCGILVLLVFLIDEFTKSVISRLFKD